MHKEVATKTSTMELLSQDKGLQALLADCVRLLHGFDQASLIFRKENLPPIRIQRDPSGLWVSLLGEF